jgi:hypothetical protein
MKKLLAVLALVVVVAGAFAAWYKYVRVESPKEAWLRTTAAAMLGDEQTFLAGFTDQSRPLVAGLLAHARGEDTKQSRQHPYFYLVSENLESVDVDGDTAWLKLRRQADTGAGAKYDVPMQKVGQTWQIDALRFTGKERPVAKK